MNMTFGAIKENTVFIHKNGLLFTKTNKNYATTSDDKIYFVPVNMYVELFFS
jgi:hypothetical protein